MATDQQQYQTIKSLALAQLAELRASPKPAYSIDGQSVSWESYLASLERTIDWCDEKLRGEEPFEFSTQGYTS
jgi:hypothetical protein